MQARLHRLYRLNLAAIQKLESVLEPDDEPSGGTGFSLDPVQQEPLTGSRADEAPGPRRPPNHPKTNLEPPTRAKAREAEDEDFQKVWSAYPEDRRRGRDSCHEYFRVALAQGFTAAEIRAAITDYAVESDGFTRSKVSFSDNWFRAERWRPRVEVGRSAVSASEAKTEEYLRGLAERVKVRDWYCQYVGPAQARMLIERGLVSEDDIRRAGIAS